MPAILGLALQCLFHVVPFGLSGWSGIGLFTLQAGTAIWQHELANYIELRDRLRDVLFDIETAIRVDS